MTFTAKIKDKFTMDRSVLEEIPGEVAKDNMSMLQTMSMFATAAFSVMTILSLFVPSISDNFVLYTVSVVVSIVFYLITVKGVDDHTSVIVVNCFIFAVLFFGVLLGTVFSGDELTVNYVVLLFAAPLMFIPTPIVTSLVIVASIILYIAVGYFTQSTDMLMYNMINVLAFGILSILLSVFVGKIKAQRIYLLKKNADLEQINETSYEDRKDYESFINEMARNASKQADPQQSINELLKFIGERLNSDRAYIFEENEEGSFDNTYEWCRHGVSAQINNLKKLPYEGLIEVWFEQYRKNSNVLIYDLEEYKNENEPMYNVLKPQGIKTLVTGPITIDGKMIGFYGVDNPPEKAMNNISELINMMEFVFSMMVRMRNDRRTVENAAVYDQLTGCKNRNALSWIYAKHYDKNQPIAVVLCDLNGVKSINNLQGHEAGDNFIVRAAGILKDTFGKEHVYRIGGDEFLTVLMGSELKNFEARVESLRLNMGNTACFGIEKRESADISFDELLSYADKKVYLDKKMFYGQHPEEKDGYRDASENKA